MGAALIAAMVLLLPFYPGLRYGVEGVQARRLQLDQAAGAMGAIRDLRERAWQLAVSAVRAVRDRRRRPAVAFTSGRGGAADPLVGLPPIVLFAGSYLVTPMLVTRYLISSFVPVFILTAIGIESLSSRNYRAAAIVAIVSLSLLRVSSDLRAGDTRWRDACEIALTKAGPQRRLGTYNEILPD